MHDSVTITLENSPVVIRFDPEENSVYRDKFGIKNFCRTTYVQNPLKSVSGKKYYSSKNAGV